MGDHCRVGMVFVDDKAPVLKLLQYWELACPHLHMVDMTNGSHLVRREAGPQLTLELCCPSLMHTKINFNNP